MAKLSELIKYATLVRNSIELNLKELSPGFTFFPGGACGAASDVLGTYFIDLGFSPTFYVVRHFPDGDQNPSHAWLEYKDFIIDISADQFNNKPKILGVSAQRKRVEVTTDKTWWENTFSYDMLNAGKRNAHLVYFRNGGDISTATTIEKDYKIVLESIPIEFHPKKLIS